MTIGSCFAGIGAFDLAFSRCGATTAWTIEIDGNCNRLLEKRFPEAIQVRNIHDAGSHNLKPVDIIVGGSPCQSFSVAGLRKGSDDPRGNLIFEFLRIVSELRPHFVVWENVPGILSDKTFALDSFLNGLEEAHYVIIGLDILDAQFFGLAQRRRRVFLCAQSLDSLLNQKTATSASILLQCLTEIFQNILVALKDQWTPGAESSGLGSGEQLRSATRRMTLFGLHTAEQASKWLDNLNALRLSFVRAHDDLESNHGLRSSRERGITEDTNSDSSKTETENRFDQQSIDASWRSTLEEGLMEARSFITSTAGNGTIESRIFTCAKACLSIAKFTLAYCRSSQNYWKTAASSSTVLVDFIEYARQASSSIFGEMGRLRCWDAFIREADAVCGAFGRSRVKDFGALLPVSQGLLWNPAPRREARQEIAGTLGARATAGGGFGTDFECAGGLQAFGCNRQSGPLEVAGALNACATSSGRQDFETETFIAHPEPAPIQSVNMKRERKQNGIGIGENGDPMFTLTGRDQHAIALAQNQRGELTENDTAGALSSGGGIPGQGYPCVAFTERTRSDGRNLETSDLAYCLTNPGSGGRTHSRQLMQGTMVRRLTPTECERLQGFPDGWTEGFSDSVRYRMLGNSVAVPVVEWIARRLMNP